MGYRYEIKSTCDVEIEGIKDLVTKALGSDGEDIINSLSFLSQLVERLNNRLNTNIQLYANCVSQYDKMVSVYEEEIDHLKERIQALETRINIQCHQLNVAQREKTDADNEAYALRLENERLKKQLQDRTNRLTYLEELNKMLLEDYNGQTDNLG